VAANAGVPASHTMTAAAAARLELKMDRGKPRFI
jgi:hypothetical protein